MVGDTPNECKEKEGARPKRVFTPTIPQRRTITAESALLPSSLLGSKPNASHNKGRRPGSSNGRPTEGRGRGSGPTSSVTASGPFALGPSSSSSVNSGGTVAPSVVTATAGMITDPYARNESSTSTKTEEIPWWDIKKALGESEWAPKVLDMIQEDGDKVDSQKDSKPMVSTSPISLLESSPDSLHLLQMPPILPEFDPSSLPMKQKNEHGELTLIDPPLNSNENAERVMEGQIGELIIRQSGKMQLKIGEFYFNVGIF
ncbi:hypothetical protein HMI56_007547 [Coelomomyces lativittatus]|nr:hypothetical protein HMI56_007547 [Coelomomyces lativittatus]